MTANLITPELPLQPTNQTNLDINRPGIGSAPVGRAPWAIPSPAGRSDYEQSLNRALEAHSSQENYLIQNGRLVPCIPFSLNLGAIQRLYPKIVTSFLSIGSRKGYFVLDAALRYPYCRAVGLETGYPRVQLATQVRDYLGLGNAAFYQATLDEAIDSVHPDVRPFQTVVFLGTYRHLFWGSQANPVACYDHRAILSRLARLNTERMIFSAPLEIDRLPATLRAQARNHPAAIHYNTHSFLAAAREFYQITPCGYLGQDALYLMMRKPAL